MIQINNMLNLINKDIFNFVPNNFYKVSNAYVASVYRLIVVFTQIYSLFHPEVSYHFIVVRHDYILNFAYYIYRFAYKFQVFTMIITNSLNLSKEK